MLDNEEKFFIYIRFLYIYNKYIIVYKYIQYEMMQGKSWNEHREMKMGEWTKWRMRQRMIQNEKKVAQKRTKWGARWKIMGKRNRKLREKERGKREKEKLRLRREEGESKRNKRLKKY